MRNIDFFRDEVRNGFYIPTAVKQGWAIALDVLGEIDRICEKHDIRYFADWGTFLGAVRHGGFVPWDDDIDICMLRDDYNRFREVADKELPEGYVIHDYERQVDHWEFTVRVVHSQKISFDKDHLDKNYNFPWLVGVDVFVKDYIFPDKDKEKRRSDEVMYLIALTESILDGDIDKRTLDNNLNNVNKKYGSSLKASQNERDICIGLFKIAERLMNEVDPSDTDLVEQIYPWIIKGAPGRPKADYENIIRLPFEDTTIPVPACFNKVLSMRYGNYLEIHKVWGGHNYPFFEGQRTELEEINGSALPEYTFDKNMLVRQEKDDSNSLKGLASACLNELKLKIADINICIENNDETAIDLLEESQQLCVDLGNLIEIVKGTERECTHKAVTALEEYCEMLYNVSQGEPTETLERSLAELSKVITENIINRKEKVFLPIGPVEWEGMKAFYEEASSDPDTDVFVVPLPLMTKDIYGQITMSEEDIAKAAKIEEYPEGIDYSDWMDFDMSLHFPDEVYVQNPYDEKNQYLTVPPSFFARSLRQYTDKIIYIPFAETTDPALDNPVDSYATKYYITAPGVIYSDEIIVRSDKTRAYYIEKLTGFAGEDTRDHWENKISVHKEVMMAEGNSVKHMLYMIGANELAEHKDVLISSVKDRLDTFRENKDNLKVTIALFPSNRDEWKRVAPELSEELFSMIDSAANEDLFDIRTILPTEGEAVTEEYDAYYGSPCFMPPHFVSKKKPVMICNYDLNNPE